MKKILTALLVAVMTVAMGAAIFIDNYAGANSASALTAAVMAAETDTDASINITSKAAYLMEFDTGTVLFKHNHQERYPIASMCKIMTLTLIYERMEQGNFSETDNITVSEEAAGMGGSQVFLSANKSYNIGDLVKSITVASANDASVAMAEHIAGSEEGFVKLMNEKASSLGMNNTNFTNCTGLPKPGQYSTAEDVAIMTRSLLSHKGYYNYSRIWMDTLKHEGGRETGLTNTNKLVRFYKGCDGGKTGYTSEAKHCISATAVRDGMRLISIVIGAENSKERFAEASKMLNHGFANFSAKKIISADSPLELKLSVKGGKAKAIELRAQEDFSLLTEKNKKPEYKLDYALPDSVKAPVKSGDVVGKIFIINNNEIIKEINVIAAQDVEPNSFGGIIGDIIRNW